MERYAGLPPLPARIERLPELALDLWWSWHDEARIGLPAPRLPAVARDGAQPGAHALDGARAPPSSAPRRIPTWLQLVRPGARRSSMPRARRTTRGVRSTCPDLKGQSIAYFSAEFALHQSLPIYAGGLGVLAGDHCKEASDLGVPLIGVGFMYPQGYFHQHISADGWQEEGYEKLNWADAPIEPATDARRQAVHHRRAARRSHGARRGVARPPGPRASCTCSTPTSRRTRRGIASCRRASTAATARRASSRRSSSASAASARCARWARRRRSGT